MPAKKKARTKAISDSDVLAMYEAIIPLIYDNPERLYVAYQINRRILTFVPFKFLHYIMEGEGMPKRFATNITTLSGFGHSEQDPNISVVPVKEAVSDEAFDESVQRNYRTIVQSYMVAHPDSKEFHYHRIESRVYPQIVVGFFRVKDARDDNNFSKEEIECFDQLTQHIFKLFRVALTQVQQSEAFRYFDSFAKIGSRITIEYSLSESETKLIPEILFGYSTEEIAERNFVSLATVKTHINHILKKTGTKSRLDFIGKFFTSPDHVQM